MSSINNAETAAVATTPQLRKILPTIIASGLEGYDLTIYGLFAGAIARQFFPAGEGNLALLLTVATLGLGYIVRPVGGIIMGAYADRVGRKPAIFLTVALMAVSTGVMGLIPSYASIGVAAPILVLLARLIQGFAAGGGASSSISFLAEMAPAKRRGYFASWHQTVQIGSFLFCSALAAIIAHLVPAEHASSIGWRIPFLLALVFGPLAWRIKSTLQEPAALLKEKAVSVEQRRSAHIARSLRSEVKSVVLGFGISCLWTSSVFLLLIFMPTFANRTFGIPLSGGYNAAVIGGCVLVVLTPFFGAVSDRFGRKNTMLTAAVIFAIAIYPLFAYVGANKDVTSLMLAEVVFAVLIGAYTGPVGAMMAELFPTGIRSTALSIANNLAVTIVGAFAPLTTTYLIGVTHDPLASAYYIMGAAIVSAIALVFVKDLTGVEMLK